MSSKCPIIRAKCPESAEGCPCWHEVYMENASTGESKIMKDCVFRLIPFFMTEMIRSANAPAAAIEQTRNDLCTALGAIASGVHALPKRVNDGKPLLDKDH